MQAHPIDSAAEVKRLRRCMNDLVSVLALPTVWAGREPLEILTTCLDSLLGLLDLDFLFARARVETQREPIEALRLHPSRPTKLDQRELMQALDRWLLEDQGNSLAEGQRRLEGEQVSIFRMQMGIDDDFGILVAGTQRSGFPEQTEKLVLSVAANQTAIGLQQARMLSEQKRVARELDERVTQKTRELAAANEQLKETERESRLIIDTIPALVWCMLPDGTNEFISKGWHEYTGVAPEDSRGWGWQTSFHPDDLPPLMKKWGEVLASGEPGEIEARLRRRDGMYRWFLIRTSPFRDAAGNIVRWYGTSTEIDDRKLAEDKLKRSESRHRVVVETATDAVISMDGSGVIILANPATKRIFGHEAAELIGKPLTVLMPEYMRELHETGYKRYLKTGTRHLNWQGTEVTALRANGEEFPVEVSFGEMTIGGRKIFTGFIRDISEKKRAEEALRESENNLRLIVDTIPGLICTLKKNWEVERVNQPLREYFGMTVEEIEDWEFFGVVHPSDLERAVAMCRHAEETGEPCDIEYRCRRYDGVFRWFQVRAMPFRDETGQIARWYLLLTDIEDRKRAEEALHASEGNLRLIINTMPVLAWSAQPDGRIEFINQRWLKYTGLSPAEARDWGWVRAMHPDDRDRVTNYWQSIIATGESGEIEARLQRFDGNYRWFLFRANPLRDESDAIVQWYGTNTDIDDRKRAEEAVRERELNLRQITETIPEMLWRATLDGTIDYCNGRLLDYTGFRAEEVMGDGWMGLLHPDDVRPTAQAWRTSIQTGDPYRVEARIFHAADRTYRWCVANALPLRDGNGHIVQWHGTLVDMHDWKQAQEELRDAQAELAKMIRVTTMGELTASIAHEVNQPLSGIITNANTCLRMLEGNSPDIEGARETARRTIRDGNRASDVITRLRTLFSRKEVITEPVDLNEAAREVIALIMSELQRNGAILQYEFADHLPIVNGDRIQLQQVILNLLRNASDAMRDIEDRQRRLLIRTEQVEEHVRVTVQDSGIGFDPAIAHRLFESFYTTKPEGMGIGLSVCRSIIEAHHGELWARPNDGPGATFSFSIPCA